MNSDVVVSKVSKPVRMAEIKEEQKAENLEYNERKKSPYRKWIQMNNDENSYEAEDWLVAKSPTAYRILRFLVSSMDNYNAVICSYAIRLLKDHQFIQVVRTGGANVYLVNKHLYWNSWGSNYAYASFEAKVIISASEQDKATQAKIRIQIKKNQGVIRDS